MSVIVAVGALLTAFGVAVLAGFAPQVADYAYAIVWWGVLMLVDEWNRRRLGLSLWSGHAGRFFGITLPVSVLFWLGFEVLNLWSPQWRYRGGVRSLDGQVMFGFVAFSTVIPIMVEAWWAVAGRICVPASFAAVCRRWRWRSVAAGIVLLLIPFFNHVFWFNQGMWLAPAFLILPWVHFEESGSPGRFALRLAASALAGGVAWEAFNYWARTHWEYLILPNAPHLFQMPVPGYLGFIPFALSALAVYEWQARWRVRAGTVLALYAIAFGVLYVLTVEYIRRGLWLYV